MTTFTRTRAGVFNEADNTFSSGTTTTIDGSAIQVRGNPMRYQALGLNLSTMPTLFFSPTLYTLQAGTPDFVLPGDVVTWAGQVYAVMDVDPIAPDGIVIAARIVVST